MSAPQPGIFALGTASHAYLELDLVGRAERRELVRPCRRCASRGRRWAGSTSSPGSGPSCGGGRARRRAAELDGFDADLVGADGFTMPATQHDAVLWLSGSAYDVVFDVARAAIAALARPRRGRRGDLELAVPARPRPDGVHRRDREPDAASRRPRSSLVPDGEPGAGGTMLLLQKWVHDAAAWEALPVAEQERVIGRTKLDSVELEDKPDDSHVASTDQDTFGKIFRRNMPYGTVTDHGTMFVGLRREQRPLAAMLESMAGLDERHARRADALHAAGHRRVLLRARRATRCSASAELQTRNELGRPAVPDEAGMSTSPHPHADRLSVFRLGSSASVRRRLSALRHPGSCRGETGALSKALSATPARIASSSPRGLEKRSRPCPSPDTIGPRKGFALGWLHAHVRQLRARRRGAAGGAHLDRQRLLLHPRRRRVGGRRRRPLPGYLRPRRLQPRDHDHGRDARSSNEDLVNLPNWLVLKLRIEGEEAITLDERRAAGLPPRARHPRHRSLTRELRFRDRGRPRDHAAQPPLRVTWRTSIRAAIEWTITAENWSGQVEVVSALDGRVTNRGVARYRAARGPPPRPRLAADVRTRGDRAQGRDPPVAACTSRRRRAPRVYRGRPAGRGRAQPVSDRGLHPAGRWSSTWSRASRCGIEKMVAFYTSKDRAISEPLGSAGKSARRYPGFDEALARHTAAWGELWRRRAT